MNTSAGSVREPELAQNPAGVKPLFKKLRFTCLFGATATPGRPQLAVTAHSDHVTKGGGVCAGRNEATEGKCLGKCTQIWRLGEKK